MNLKNRGFTQYHSSFKFQFVIGDIFLSRQKKRRNALKNGAGFTLIELLVVVAIIAVLASIAMVAVQSGRQKSRDAKRLSDMSQLATAMELYFNTNKGYPSQISDLSAISITPPVSPQPADGDCPSLTYPVVSLPADRYHYYPSPTGGSYVLNGLTLYPDYIYFFCLGNTTGSFPPGIHQVSPKGVR